MARTKSPREAAEEIGGIGEYALREGAKKERFPHVRGSRNAIRFTDEQIAEIVAILTRPATVQKPKGLTSARSRGPRKPAAA